MKPRIVQEFEGQSPCKWTVRDTKTGDRLAWGQSETRQDAENSAQALAEHHRKLRHCD